MGVTGSGKTTIGKLLARDLGWKYLDADDFHSAANVSRMAQGIPLTDDDRAPWLLRLREAIDDSLVKVQPAVLACSALKDSYRHQLLFDSRVQLVYLKGDASLIAKRLSERQGHYMNPALLESQFEALEEPQNSFTICIAASPRAIVAAIKEHFQLEASDS
jgi:gluconokinase